MSDSDEFEYESDDDPYGGQEEEVNHKLNALHLCLVLMQATRMGTKRPSRLRTPSMRQPASLPVCCGNWSLESLSMGGKADDNKQNYPEQVLPHLRIAAAAVFGLCTA